MEGDAAGAVRRAGVSNKDTIYPFQLRPGFWVYLKLPEDLTKAEVDRLREFLAALVLGERE